MSYALNPDEIDLFGGCCRPSCLSPRHRSPAPVALRKPTMVVAQSSADASRHSPPPTRWSTTAVAVASKLRDSCHACASSKVKCSKEKPICSRCAKRGTACEYLVTKRPGRKHENRSIDRTAARANAAQALNDSSWPSLLSSSSVEPSAPLSVAPHSARDGENSSIISSDIFPLLLSPVDNSLSSILEPMNTDFDDFFAPSLCFSSVPGGSDFDILAQGQLFSSNGRKSSSRSSSVVGGAQVSGPPEDTIYLFGETVPDNLRASHSQSPPSAGSAHPSPSLASNTGSSVADHARQHRDLHAADSSCRCLMRALDLMKRLLANDIAPCTLAGQPAHENADRVRPPTIHAVIAMNKRTIDATSQMLQCSCSKDSYLLTIVSLIVFKVLGWYAAAARTSTAVSIDNTMTDDDDVLTGLSPGSSRHSEQVLYSPTSLDGSDGEDLGRVAAQLVLGELHRVQSLVNQFSFRLKACGPHSTTGMGAIAGIAENRHSLLTGAGDTPPAFSASLLDGLEPELRIRIRSLSSEIIHLLRRD